KEPWLQAVVHEGRNVGLEEGEQDIAGERQNEPLVALPLKINEQVLGVLAVHKFFPQKTELATVDRELFTLLAGHAATALFSAKVYTESQRKIDTFKSVIDLITADARNNPQEA